MNYYPFHIGDFAAHTAHLSWEEDIAYRRMLDWYYLNEKALPLDVVKVARLVRMPKSLKAIQVVLDEFFVNSEDGWHNKRADEELTLMLAKQEHQATKDEHEAERMRRYRERRAVMFAALRAVHVVPAWDAPMKELQRLFDTHCNAPETRTGPLPETDSQRLSIPTPTPIPNKDIGSGSAELPTKTVTARMLASEGVEKQTADDWLTLRKAKRLPLTQTAWADTKAEGEKVGLCPAETVAHAVKSNWAGFKASWYTRDAASGAAAAPLGAFV